MVVYCDEGCEVLFPCLLESNYEEGELAVQLETSRVCAGPGNIGSTEIDTDGMIKGQKGLVGWMRSRPSVGSCIESLEILSPFDRSESPSPPAFSRFQCAARNTRFRSYPCRGSRDDSRSCRRPAYLCRLTCFLCPVRPVKEPCVRGCWKWSSSRKYC